MRPSPRRGARREAPGRRSLCQGSPTRDPSRQRAAGHATIACRPPPSAFPSLEVLPAAVESSAPGAALAQPHRPAHAAGPRPRVPRHGLTCRPRPPTPHARCPRMWSASASRGQSQCPDCRQCFRGGSRYSSIHLRLSSLPCKRRQDGRGEDGAGGGNGGHVMASEAAPAVSEEWHAADDASGVQAAGRHGADEGGGRSRADPGRPELHSRSSRELGASLSRYSGASRQ
mmetsp:Transcript_64964/g.186704  ORF Transcript_64964/g.186704 Transcript_64964/m.186704 type:complete len:229 (-) Transcript_64964:163-849(-)